MTNPYGATGFRLATREEQKELDAAREALDALPGDEVVPSAVADYVTDPDVVALLIDGDGWHDVVPGSLALSGRPRFAFHDVDGVTWSGPATSVLAVRNAGSAGVVKVPGAPDPRKPTARAR